ncbi:hypothetical protein JS82_02660 [Methanomassiliicoccaceae archaeon DOK]|nr:hypothetical protein JS82_02660 [Methanomassiliicoccaceae archaeon DOK]
MESEETSRTAGKGSALKALVSFFTLWHMDIDQDDMDDMERKFHLVPFVALFFSVFIIIEMVVMQWLSKNYGFGSDLFAAVVVLATVFIGSKFIHFDGLTDFGDGMIVSGAQEDHVRALKDTLVGAGGIGVALIVILFSVSTYSMAGIAFLLVFAPICEVMVKNAMVFAAAFGTPGHGMAGRQVSMTTTNSAVYSAVISIILGAVLAVITCAIFDQMFPTRSGIDVVAVLFGVVIATAVSAVVGYLMARNANKVFGMVNGDILGATNEVSRPVVMVSMVLPFICWL